MSRALKINKIEVSFRLWNLMREEEGVKVDTKAVNILLNAYAKNGDFDGASGVFDEMLGRTGRTKDSMLPAGSHCPPNVVSYNTLIDASYRCGDLVKGMKALEMMKEKRIRPDTRTYTTLISTVGLGVGVVGANNPDAAFELFEEMETEKVFPNGKTYCALINVCKRVRRPDLALRVLRLMGERGWCEGGGKLRAGTHFYISNVNDVVAAWTATIDACGKSGRVETGLSLFESMKKSGVIVPNEVTCSCMFDLLVRGGFLGKAVEVLKYMKIRGLVPTEYMYTTMLMAAGGEGGVDSNEIYVELVSLLSSNPGGNKKSKTQTPWEGDDTLMKVFLLFYEVENPDIVCFNTLLSVCARVGDVERAVSLLKRIEGGGEDVDVFPNVRTYGEMLKATWVGKRKDVGEWLLKKLEVSVYL
ncbi:hypothetical protein TL16_g05547 [Triparma laevis f. inornata]|uniref:Pentatricopeptide repeat-containing protein n=2 Tax=Triparma laevis TaxID=1534972 RepID=A0A9W7A5S6_9STRA|nr:hypothetical protein TrLO_g9131 [Triparma laevis f. longispina]GMH71019.1 hypothetical protein TL16_g05547 [Triparma laevis f. inornata]